MREGAVDIIFDDNGSVQRPLVTVVDVVVVVYHLLLLTMFALDRVGCGLALVIGTRGGCSWGGSPHHYC